MSEKTFVFTVLTVIDGKTVKQESVSLTRTEAAMSVVEATGHRPVNVRARAQKIASNRIALYSSKVAEGKLLEVFVRNGGIEEVATRH